MTAITSPLAQFFDLDGSPLSSGYVYIGTANGNPETSPVTAYWDSALTQPAAQPLRTLNGYIVRGGTPAQVYAAADWSITVKTAAGALVVYAPTAADYALSLSLAGASGSSQVGFIAAGTGAVTRTMQDKAREMVSVKDFGAVGDGTTDDTAAFLAVIATGKVGFVPFGNYKLTAALPLTEGGFVGEGFGIGGAGAQFAVLTFYNLTSTTNGAIYTRLATQKSNFARLENLYIQASSWDGVTGCSGYGLDIEAPIICDRVVVYGFKKSGVFLHHNTGGTGGPYQSRLTNVRSLYSGQHGILVGAGANAFGIQSCEGKWSGAPSYGVAPSVAGSYDGLHIENTADGGGYASFVPTAVTVIGGDFSYNSQHGMNVVDCDGGNLGGGYSEGNLGAKQVRAGAGAKRGMYDFGFAVGAVADLIDIDTVDTANSQTCTIRVNGFDFGGAANVAQTIMYDKQLSTANGRTRQMFLGADDVGATNSTVIQAATDGNAYYYGQGTGRHVFSNGLKVGNVAQSDVAVLDWYEEGTFVPAIVGTSSAGVGTYSPTPTGTYTRIGNRVFFDIDITWSAHTGTGNMKISTLPFTAAGAGVTSLTYTTLAVGAGKTLGAQVLGTDLTLYSQDPAGGAVAAVAIDTAASIVLSGVYRV